jgi:hypothetical protein
LAGVVRFRPEPAGGNLPSRVCSRRDNFGHSSDESAHSRHGKFLPKNGSGGNEEFNKSAGIQSPGGMCLEPKAFLQETKLSRERDD